jgi:hypothetical protein
MHRLTFRSAFCAAFFISTLVVPVTASDEEGLPSPSGENCTFKSTPEDLVSSQARAHSELFERVRQFAATRAGKQGRTIAASSLPRRNFIDEQIFNRLDQEGVPAAELSNDEDFFRRVTLDLTGRIPSASEIRAFLENRDANKRDALIDKLVESPEFVDKWANWLGDLVQVLEPRPATVNFGQEFDGRNAFFNYIRKSIGEGKSLRDMAYEMVASSGNNFANDMGQLNFISTSSAANGPAQDTYDLMMVRSTTTFLGLAHYDCLVCHSGRGHLNVVSSWGTKVTRTDAWRMSAFFARTRLQRNYGNQALQFGFPLYNSTDVIDITTDQYNLNVLNGNRPPRCYNGLPVDPVTNRCPTAPNADANRVFPEYRDGRKPATNESWRAAFAKFMVDDPMFTRNFANRLWKAMFNLALAEPMDALDPDRLDPRNPPPAPWAFQASHPELLQRLADHFAENNYNIRETLRLIAKSSAYQLSSKYDGEWSAAKVNLFARHYPRRLDAEEIHDAIAKATGNLGSYTIQATRVRDSATAPAVILPDRVQWAMQLPDTSEPRSNGAVSTFLNTFLRGNRDTQSRSQSGSILQQLALMNDAFVNNRTRLANSPVLTNISRLPNNDLIVDEMFLTFLSRQPSQRERSVALTFLGRATNQTAKNTAVEDLAWALINKIDFLFSY